MIYIRVNILLTFDTGRLSLYATSIQLPWLIRPFFALVLLVLQA